MSSRSAGVVCVCVCDSGGRACITCTNAAQLTGTDHRLQVVLHNSSLLPAELTIA